MLEIDILYTYELGESPDVSVSSDTKVFQSKPTARVTDIRHSSGGDLGLFTTWINHEIFEINGRQTVCYPQTLSGASHEGHTLGYVTSRALV